MGAKRVVIWAAFLSLLAFGVSSAEAQDPTVAGPRVGGHLGAALPLVTVASKTTVIGADFVNVGVTPGITVKLDDHWAVDFEFIAFNKWKNGTTATTFVVDPGVVYSWSRLVTGLRVATEVGAPRNIALVPIVVLPFQVRTGLSYFVELDLPMFLRDDGNKMQPSITALLQSGFAF